MHAIFQIANLISIISTNITTRASSESSHDGKIESTSEFSSTFENNSEVSSTFENTSEVPSTFENTSEVSSTFENTSEISSTFENTLDFSSTFENTSEVSSTFENSLEFKSTSENTLEVSSTFKNTLELSSTFENTSELSSTIENTSELSSTIENTSELSFRMHPSYRRRFDFTPIKKISAQKDRFQPKRGINYNPSIGYEPYWENGDWVHKWLLEKINKSTICVPHCSKLYIRYGKICGVNKHFESQTFNSYCDLLELDCDGRKGWMIAYRGECQGEVPTYPTVPSIVVPFIASRAAYFITEFYKQYPNLQ
ncbi:hypothetical protein ACJJTC_002152 [Scirpophaga incertulas]